ncbi:MAG: hypothetical protein KVP17_000129 [Porospora cf. gigantea B]|uniref:uncharacterized protein n=2 Tax=Porospora cf. gigantea B TaxID=2853592 RepID=UPI00357183F6|nr:MAG: hypothetical protein KVP17_000129 [Porospora cf. gigantea B]
MTRFDDLPTDFLHSVLLFFRAGSSPAESGETCCLIKAKMLRLNKKAAERVKALPCYRFMRVEAHGLLNESQKRRCRSFTVDDHSQRLFNQMLVRQEVNVVNLMFFGNFQWIRFQPLIATNSSVRFLSVLSFDEPLQSGWLPPSLETLHALEYGYELLQGVLPLGLKRLHICRFNYELVEGSLPASLEYLRLDSYTKALKPDVLPKGLKRLDLPVHRRHLFSRTLDESSEYGLDEALVYREYDPFALEDNYDLPMYGGDDDYRPAYTDYIDNSYFSDEEPSYFSDGDFDTLRNETISADYYSGSAPSTIYSGTIPSPSTITSYEYSGSASSPIHSGSASSSIHSGTIPSSIGSVSYDDYIGATETRGSLSS